jgi:nitrogen fixation/metabolism regulation signal transduction histidine kinase
MKARPTAAEGMAGGPVPRRHLVPDIVSVFLVYIVSGIGLFVVGRSVIAEGPVGGWTASPLLLLGVLPLATLVILGFQFRDLLRDQLRRRYGARLRFKLAILFLGVVVASTLPQGLFALRLVGITSERLRSGATSHGIDEGLGLLLDWRDADSARLDALARSALLSLLAESAATVPFASLPMAILGGLQRLEPRLEAVEVFRPGGKPLAAGPAEARLASPPPAGVAGSLPAETKAGVSRLRNATAWKGSTIVLCLRLPAGFETATAAMAAANAGAAELEKAAATWPSYLALMYGLFVLPLLLLALLLGVAAADFVAEPLAGLEEATKRIASGDHGLRLLAKPGDERGWLLASFNRMLDEMARWREGDLIQGRIDAWKDIAQRLAHELKNPLTPIRLASERLLRTGRNDPARALEILESSTLAIISEVDSMAGLLDDFKAFASLPTPQPDWVPLADLLEESVAVYRASYPDVDFAIGTLPAEIRLHVDRSMVKRAFGNLLANSIEAMEGSGRIDLSADLVKTGDSGYCRIRLSDSGSGIAPEHRERIFTPYFTTKATGTGLGLAIVERIVHDHDGRIRFESSPGSGTVFWIDLPVER